MRKQKDPLETRRALNERFPRWTQPLWTWITGIAMPGEKPLRPWSMRMHLAVLLLAWLATLLLGVAGVAMLLAATLGA